MATRANRTRGADRSRPLTTTRKGQTMTMTSILSNTPKGLDLVRTAQKERAAQKAAKQDKQVKAVIRGISDMPILGAYGNPGETDIRSELAQMVTKGAERHEAAVRHVVGVRDNMDESPIVLYTALKVQWERIGCKYPSFVDFANGTWKAGTVK